MAMLLGNQGYSCLGKCLSLLIPSTASTALISKHKEELLHATVIAVK